MAKITFNRVVSNFGFKTAFNNLLGRIEQEFQDKVLYRNNPTGEPNSMSVDLDMNGKDLLNARKINATGLLVDGKDVYQVLNDALTAPNNSAVAAANAAASAVSASNAASSAAEAATSASNAAATIPSAMTITGADVEFNGQVTTKSSTKTLGYSTGAGGTVVQSTSKSTPVTLNKPCGQITMHNATLAGGAGVSFALNNSVIKSTDVVNISIQSGNGNQYNVWTYGQSDGQVGIVLQNVISSPLTESVVLNFVVVKGVVA